MDAYSIHCQQFSSLFDFPIPETCTDTRREDYVFNHDDMVPIMSSAGYHDTMSSSIPDCMAVPSLSGYNGLVFDQENISGLIVAGFWPATYDHIASHNRGLHSKEVTKVEEPCEGKIGKYSVEEKKGRILRYLKKRNQRNFNKTIKYACRKNLPDKRARVHGRFAKNNEPSKEYETKTKDEHSLVLGQNASFYDDSSLQMICREDDDWLQAAMASLV